MRLRIKELRRGAERMNEYMPSDKELIQNLIDKFTDLQRIKGAADMQKEVEYQIMITRAKLDAMGVVTENLEWN